MSNRFFIEFSFLGTDYHGWQIQPDAISVQEIMEKALSNLLREKINLTGAGRTDAGVHASYFVAHFESSCMSDPRFIVQKLNRYLHSSIAVFRIIPVYENFHARFDAISRTYKYVISRHKQPFLDKLCYYYHKDLDLDAMDRASKILINTEDFTSFAKLHGGNKTNICNISLAKWLSFDGWIIFTVKADRFLRNMVRSLTGTLMDVGKGKMGVREFKEIIEAGNNQMASASAPAHALFLFDIEYPDEYGLKNPVLKSSLPFSW